MEENMTKFGIKGDEKPRFKPWEKINNQRKKIKTFLFHFFIPNTT